MSKARIIVKDNAKDKTLTGDWLEVSDVGNTANEILFAKVREVLEGRAEFLNVIREEDDWMIPRDYLVKHCLVVVENHKG